MSARDIYYVGPHATGAAQAAAIRDHSWTIHAFETLPLMEFGNAPGAIIVTDELSTRIAQTISTLPAHCRPSLISLQDATNLVETIERDWISQSLAQFEELGGPDFVAEMLDLFRKQSVQYLADLKAALEAECSATVRRVVHTLKSSLGSFGARQLKELAQQMENDAAKDDLDNVRKDLPILVEGIDRFVKLLPVLEPYIN